MGGMWTSVTLRTGDASKVEAAVATLGRTAYVSPAKDGWTCVFDEATEGQDSPTARSRRSSTSSKGGCARLSTGTRDQRRG